jgi:hypothetical protein
MAGADFDGNGRFHGRLGTGKGHVGQKLHQGAGIIGGDREPDSGQVDD